MKQGFLDKLIARIGRVEPEEIQNYLGRLVQEKGFLERVFDVLQEGVVIIDGGRHVNYINRAACSFFGLDQETALDKRVDSQLRGIDWAALTSARQTVSRDLEVFYPENRYLNFYLSPIEGAEQGEVLGFVMIVHDITMKRRVAEEKIESERMTALTMLAAGVAHELGNPLNSLNIHLQLLERKLRKAAPDLYQSQLKEILDVSREEIGRLDFTISQFLKAIRPTQPQLELHDLNTLIRESVRFLEKELSDRDIAVTLELHSRIPPIPLDANQIKQAFYNIIRNAMQAMNPGGRLHVHSDRTEEEILIGFTDDGGGIPAEVMGKVFDPYFTTKKSGTGLGLLIVRRIVREHGGEIELTSRENEGTRLVIHLPISAKGPRLLPSASEGSVIEV